MAKIQQDKPKNRIAHSLPILEIHIDSEGESHKFDPNALAMLSCSGAYPIGQPIKGLASVISGKPAYLWREDNLEIAMTLDELDRFARLSLRPKEFKILYERFGEFYHIHDDFYDPDTGGAFQPRPKTSGLAQTKSRILSEGEHIELEAVIQTAPRQKQRKL
jgi:hypothetical protein